MDRTKSSGLVVGTWFTSMIEGTPSSTLRQRMHTGIGNGALMHSLKMRREANRKDALAEHEDPYFFSILGLYLVAQNSRKAEDLLGLHFNHLKFAIEFDETVGLPPNVFILKLNRDGLIEVTFGRVEFSRLASDSLSRLLNIVPLLDHFSRNGPFRGSVAFNLGDLGVWPGLAFCDSREVFTLIPDCTFVSTEGYLEYARHFASRATSWSGRSDTVFWRGSSTGAPVENIADLPRLKLCMLAVQNPESRLDFGLSGIVQMNSEQAASLNCSGGCKPFEPWQSLDLYKYHVDIDGNTNSWPGLLSKLHSGGLVFKVASPQGYRQWYYHRLRPWVHFVPVKSDLSDLLPLVEYMRANDDFAERIAGQGQKFARSMTLKSELEAASEAVLAHVVSTSLRA